ncbi:MAG: rhodanese-like domain-containing protein [Gammaproteobacteria bacterium]|nr:rhodanese-like domain-containing protein [Gammaproteobacteria bacterium]
MKQVQVKSITPKEAWNLVQKDPRAVLIDIRSNMEFLFIGHPKGAINVAWIDEPDWKINPHFAAEVRKVMLGGVSSVADHASAPVILICRSGKRSLEAGELLVKEGFTEVYNVLEGFEGDLDENHRRGTLGGWRYHQLPWEQC